MHARLKAARYADQPVFWRKLRTLFALTRHYGRFLPRDWQNAGHRTHSTLFLSHFPLCSYGLAYYARVGELLVTRRHACVCRNAWTQDSKTIKSICTRQAAAFFTPVIDPFDKLASCTYVHSAFSPILQSVNNYAHSCTLDYRRHNNNEKSLCIRMSNNA